MIQFQQLIIKNFFTIGNVSQTINLSDKDFILILGENVDLGGLDSTNGVGKSAILHALSYALYGLPLTNIKKDNLINTINIKNMLVTLTFDVNGALYKIVRGRKPNIFKFIKNGIEKDVASEDESQGEGRHTQDEIEKLIGITHNMFKHIVALNTNTEPFLASRVSDQREIIEQLFGITKLSEKSEKLKEEIKNTKDFIKEEEYKISAATDSNKRIEKNIETLNLKSLSWEDNKKLKLDELQNSILGLMNVNISDEILLHKSRKESNDLLQEYKSLLKDISVYDKDITEYTKTIASINKKISNTKEKICPTCSQQMNKDMHIHVHQEYTDQQKELLNKLDLANNKKKELISLSISVKSLIPELPNTFYVTVEEAYNHKLLLDSLGNSLSSEIESINPYIEQIENLKTNGIQIIDYTRINDLVILRNHQEFLNKLLTNKDSFIRMKIIEQNLSFLNFRLAYYLSTIGLPHNVIFKSDLDVEIQLYGQNYDFDNLSRGERTRLILSLSWAFRDVFESSNSKINLMFIDELVDQGLDTSGTEKVLKILKDMTRTSGKNIFLISHKDEYVSRIPNVLKVTKENRFTTLALISTQQ
jgi:DNA repair exonuclease SbcCD ATPase subunit